MTVSGIVLRVSVSEGFLLFRVEVPTSPSPRYGLTALLSRGQRRSLWAPVFFRRLGGSAWGDGRRLQCGMQLLMVVMEWVALLLGLLPLGGCRGRWSPGKTVLGVVIAGLTLLMDVTFFISNKTKMSRCPNCSQNSLCFF